MAVRASFGIRGVTTTKYALNRLEERTCKRALNRSRKGAKDIKHLASLLTPYKTGALQHSISIKENKRIGSGRGWRRVSWEVYVDPGKLKLSKNRKYYEEMHDSYYRLGPGSLAKSQRVRGSIPQGVKRGNGSSYIGMRFLSRSIDYHGPRIERDIKEIMLSEARRF